MGLVVIELLSSSRERLFLKRLEKDRLRLELKLVLLEEDNGVEGEKEPWLLFVVVIFNVDGRDGLVLVGISMAVVGRYVLYCEPSVETDDDKSGQSPLSKHSGDAERGISSSTINQEDIADDRVLMSKYTKRRKKRRV